jgi:branched-chain amino acid transport system permease protein
MTAIAATPSRTTRFGISNEVLRIGGIAAVVSLYLALVGIVGVFHRTSLVDGVVSLGETALILTGLAAGYAAALRTSTNVRGAIVNGAIAGAVGGSSLSLLVVIGQFIDLRAVLLQASLDLYNLLTFGLGLAGFWLPMAVGALLGALGGATHAAQPTLRRSLVIGVMSLLVLGAFAGLIRAPLLASPLSDMGRALFSSGGGLTLAGAIVTLAGAVGNDIGARFGGRIRARRGGQVGAVLGCVVVGILGATFGAYVGASVSGGTLLLGAVGALIGSTVGLIAGALLGAFVQRTVARGKVGERVEALPERQQRVVYMAARVALLLVALVFVLWLPIAVGSFFAQVVVLVALYVLMGLGLNITLGLAGLLDLGFVAFFAVGGYTVGLLTSTAEFGLAQWPFWLAVPFAVLFSMAFGAFLGLPILGIRGDYLAIATLGFGEIVRILAGSNLMLPLLGGPRGIINIPKPIEVPPGDILAGPIQIYYIALVCAAVIAFVAIRLRNSRLGRAWLAIREDEDVAEALGVNLVQTKLLAYMLGAAFAGLGGAVFAALIGAQFPSSINFFVSINVAALIIVGGMGSIPGVVVGAIFLIGLPELFREFSEYRLLFYGIALIAVMRFRPAGLLPSRTVARELHVAENVELAGAPVGATVAQLEGEAK